MIKRNFGTASWNALLPSIILSAEDRPCYAVIKNEQGGGKGNLHSGTLTRPRKKRPGNNGSICSWNTEFFVLAPLHRVRLVNWSRSLKWNDDEAEQVGGIGGHERRFRVVFGVDDGGGGEAGALLTCSWCTQHSSSSSKNQVRETLRLVEEVTYDLTSQSVTRPWPDRFKSEYPWNTPALLLSIHEVVRGYSSLSKTHT